MEHLEETFEAIRTRLEAKDRAREQALGHSRTLIRHCANAIRAIHRLEWEEAQARLGEARETGHLLSRTVQPYGDLHYAGYTQDAFKELAEAHITYALIRGEPLPRPEDLGVEDAAYLNGLGEATGELRRHVLDLIRRGEIVRAEGLLQVMDEVYAHLITMDFPDAVTGGLRRTTDMVRGVVERTRGDLTTAARQEELQRALEHLEDRLRPGEP
ncbi:MAG: haloacid dehalogenase [Anaerolineae bacterium]